MSPNPLRFSLFPIFEANQLPLMDNTLIRAGRMLFGSSILAIGVLQLCYPDFRPVLLPAWSLPGQIIWVWLAGFLLIGAGIAIVTERQTRKVALLLGGFFLAMFLFGHVPYELFVDPYGKHLGVWTSALKELALSGGAFAVAGSVPPAGVPPGRGPGLVALASAGPFVAARPGRSIKRGLPSGGNAGGNGIAGVLEKLIPLSRIFFSITMISFGIDHFLYPTGVSTLVPTWIPGGSLFWTYFAAVALIGSGVAIILKIKLRLVALLLGAMIGLWVIVLHIPRAVADPFGMQANEVISVFEAVNFTGIAILIAYGYYDFFALPSPTL
jgi:uncharacterized membrane protein YphA (DoxX/SURF4 family)